MYCIFKSAPPMKECIPEYWIDPTSLAGSKFNVERGISNQDMISYCNKASFSSCPRYQAFMTIYRIRNGMSYNADTSTRTSSNSVIRQEIENP